MIGKINIVAYMVQIQKRSYKNADATGILSISYLIRIPNGLILEKNVPIKFKDPSGGSARACMCMNTHGCKSSKYYILSH